MDKILIVCKSITHAQKIQNVIKKGAFWCAIDRTPRAISNKKCSYAITVNAEDFERIRVVLRVYKINDVLLFSYSDKKYTLYEVQL